MSLMFNNMIYHSKNDNKTESTGYENKKILQVNNKVERRIVVGKIENTAYQDY